MLLVVAVRGKLRLRRVRHTPNNVGARAGLRGHDVEKKKIDLAVTFFGVSFPTVRSPCVGTVNTPCFGRILEMMQQ